LESLGLHSSTGYATCVPVISFSPLDEDSLAGIQPCTEGGIYLAVNGEDQVERAERHTPWTTEIRGLSSKLHRWNGRWR
jgi:hypothetical protein